MPYYFSNKLSLAEADTICNVRQVETATAAGTITLSGNATVVITVAGATLATVSVPVTLNNVAATWAGKVRTALIATVAVTDLFAVSGSGASIILTRLVSALNDSTLNISLDNGTCTGISTAATSVNTTPGLPVGSDASPVMDGSVLAGTALTFSRADHVHPSDTSRLPSTQNLPGINKTVGFTVIDPPTAYTKSTLVPIITSTLAALHITKIVFRCDADPTTEVTGDIKWADDLIGLGNAAVIQAIDTTAGAYTSGVLDVAVAAGKCVYLSYDTGPDAATKFHSCLITYDFD